MMAVVVDAVQAGKTRSSKMSERLRTKTILMEGGLILSEPPLEVGQKFPGALKRAQNIEANRDGGYSPILGYTEYDSTAVTGTGDILGIVIVDDEVVAQRNNDLYSSTGSGWTKINGALSRPNVNKFRSAVYSLNGEWTACIVDSQNEAALYKPNGSTVYQEITHASAPTQPDCAAFHKRHLFLGQDDILYISAPNDDTNFAGASGAATINIGDLILNMAQWRNALYIFCDKSIWKVTGSSSSDWALESVTKSFGIIGPDSLQDVAGDLVYLAPDGVRTIAGTERIGDVELESLSKSVAKELEDKIGAYQTTEIMSCVVREKGQYRVMFFRDTDEDEDAQGYNGCLRPHADGSLTWEWFELRGIPMRVAWSGYIADDEYVLFAGTDGKVYRLNNGSSFNGTIINVLLELVPCPYDDPAFRKTLFDADLYIETDGALDVDFVPVLDYDDPEICQPSSTNISETTANDFYGTAIFDTSSYSTGIFPNRYKVIIEGSGFVIGWRISASTTQDQWVIKHIVVEYMVGARR